MWGGGRKRPNFFFFFRPELKFPTTVKTISWCRFPFKLLNLKRHSYFLKSIFSESNSRPSLLLSFLSSHQHTETKSRGPLTLAPEMGRAKFSLTSDDLICEQFSLLLLYVCSSFLVCCSAPAGFCMFVLSLVKKHYRLQFYMVSVGPASSCPLDHNFLSFIKS